jgi:hypothetical protein
MLDKFWKHTQRSDARHGSLSERLGAYLLNVQQNDFNKILAPRHQGAKLKYSLFLRTWRALRPFGFAQDMLCASHLFADSVTQMLTENFKYLCLGLQMR